MLDEVDDAPARGLVLDEVDGLVLEVDGLSLDVDGLVADVDGLVLEVDGLVLVLDDVLDDVLDEVEETPERGLAVTRDTWRLSPLSALNSTVTCVPGIRFAGMSEVPDSTTKRCRPVAVSITSSLSLEETTVPVTVVDDMLDEVLLDVCGCDWLDGDWLDGVCSL